MQFVRTVGTEFTFSTSAPDPFDAGSIANFPLVVHVVAYSYHDTGTFMACDALCISLHAHAQACPFTADKS